MLTFAVFVVSVKLFVGSDHEGNLATLSQNWERHVCGELALLQARGPKAFAYGDAQTTFADGRLHYVCSSKSLHDIHS